MLWINFLIFVCTSLINNRYAHTHTRARESSFTQCDALCCVLFKIVFPLAQKSRRTHAHNVYGTVLNWAKIQTFTDFKKFRFVWILAWGKTKGVSERLRAIVYVRVCVCVPFVYEEKWCQVKESSCKSGGNVTDVHNFYPLSVVGCWQWHAAFIPSAYII